MRFILCVCFNYTQKLFIHLSLAAMLLSCGKVELCSSEVTLYRAAEQLLGDNSICTLRNVAVVKELIKYSVNQVDNHP